MRNTTLNIRTTDRTKHLLQQAANMLGTTVSGFLLSTATDRAYELIQNQSHFVLDNEEWEDFCAALDRSPRKKKKLKSLLLENGVFENE